VVASTLRAVSDDALAESPAPGAPALATAARVIEAVGARGQSADAALAGAPAAVRAIALGTLRWYLRLRPAVEPLLARPQQATAAVRALLTVAAHQIVYSRNAPEASVDAAVDAVRLLGAARAAGLVNAVLRRFVVERTALLERVDRSLAGRTAHPAWLIERVCAAWPAQAEGILAANNAHPPMTLRVDRSKITVEACVTRLKSAGIDAWASQWCPSAVTLEHPRSVIDLPGFAEGLYSVQDAGAQLAGPLLQLQKGQRVLDACAAPGGKTGQLLELLGERADVTALDVDAGRMARITENLERLGRTARRVVADARDPSAFWDGRPYERILIDAPCSGTGVIRRHPDIKLLRRDSDIAAFASTQLEILTALTPLLAPGGRLLYVTCSVLPEENESVIKALLAAEGGLRPATRPRTVAIAPGAIECGVGVQLVPGAEAGIDGFYYACLEKTTAGSSNARG
jgi:16S rRNA (cytosine967-C5)-methyltransferase